jgi:creatinine amidohydrolase
MKISDMNWTDVERYLAGDDRAVLPLGSTEQHCGLGLSVDSLLSEHVAFEAAEPLGVPVFPVQPYGMTPLFMAYPGTVSLSLTTYAALIGDILSSLRQTGFRRILICNGHGGNTPAQTLAAEFMAAHPDCVVRFHNWWNAPKTFAVVQEIDSVASHASWMENFAWTRLPHTPAPDRRKPMIDLERLRLKNPAAAREYLGDGNFGGLYQRSDEDMARIWNAAVLETRELIEGPWS